MWPLSVKLAGLSLGMNVVALLLVGLVWLGINRKIAVTSANVLFLFIGYLLVSMLAAVAGPCQDKYLKSLITAPILVFLVLIGLEVGRRARSRDWQLLPKAAWWSLLIAFVGFGVEMAFPTWFPLKADYRYRGEFSGLFQEPSHAAFSLFPCIAILLVGGSDKSRRRGALALLALLVVSRSSTLIALTVAWLLYRLVSQSRLRDALLLGVSAVLVIGVGAAINYEGLLGQTTERIVGVIASSDTENLSSLVYVQGWQDAWTNFVRTRGFGLGFNMMGCHPLPDIAVRRVLSLRNFEELNAEDGSFQFGKIVSEFGICGILFYVAIIWWWIQLEKRIQSTDADDERCAASIQAAFIFCFIASSFIRAAGYFSGGPLLWVVAVSGASQWQKRQVARQLTNAVGQRRLVQVKDH